MGWLALGCLFWLGERWMGQVAGRPVGDAFPGHGVLCVYVVGGSLNSSAHPLTHPPISFQQDEFDVFMDAVNRRVAMQARRQWGTATWMTRLPAG